MEGAPDLPESERSSSTGSATADPGGGPEPPWMLVSSLQGRSGSGEMVCSFKVGDSFLGEDPLRSQHIGR